MLIRPATTADVLSVLPMLAALCRMHEELDPERYGFLDDVVARYERWLPERATDPRSVFFVAESGGEGRQASGLVGFLVASVEKNIPIYTVEEFGFVHDVWVEPEARGRGVATGLVEAAVARFAAMGVRQVRLETAAANEAARRLFARAGFRVGTIDMLRVV